MEKKDTIYEIKEGSEVCFVEGKENRHIAYDLFGKVILCKHKIPLGYAKIKTVEDRGNYYIVTAEHIIKDLYEDIGYEEFLKVLPLHGFKVGFDRIFKHKISEGKYVDEHQIFAYNLQNKMVITAETFKFNENDKKDGFNSIKIYLPGVNGFKFMRNRIFYRYNSSIAVCDAANTMTINILSKVTSIMEEHGGNWPPTEYPSLWTYENEDNIETDENGNWFLGPWALQRLKLADPECLQIFEGCNWLNELIKNNN